MFECPKCRSFWQRKEGRTGSNKFFELLKSRSSKTSKFWQFKKLLDPVLPSFTFQKDLTFGNSNTY